MKYLVTVGKNLKEEYNIKAIEAINEKDLFQQIAKDVFKDEEDHFEQLHHYFRQADGKLIWHWIDWACCTMFEFYYKELN